MSEVHNGLKRNTDAVRVDHVKDVRQTPGIIKDSTQEPE